MSTDQNFDPTMWEVDRRLQTVERQIQDLAASISEKMDRLQRNIAEGMTVNSLGELQGRGSELDRLIGQRAEIIQFKAMLEWDRHQQDGGDSD